MLTRLHANTPSRAQRPPAATEPPGSDTHVLVSGQIGVAVLVAAQFLLFGRYFFSRLRGGLGHALIFPHFGSLLRPFRSGAQGLLGMVVSAGTRLDVRYVSSFPFQSFTSGTEVI